VTDRRPTPVAVWLTLLMTSLLCGAWPITTTASDAPPEEQITVSHDEPDDPPDATQPTRARFHGTTEVVASRIASDAAAAGRREVVLTRQEIAELPVHSVQEVLALVPGAGLARRGTRGVQGDLNLRGATFEQALVMVNGVRVNNPQTGHHSLDVFVPLSSIERVEVLYGPGAAVHGPDAFGGAINIVTSAPTTSAFFRIGENDLTGGGASFTLGGGVWLAAEREVHTGFRDNTEADINQLAAGWSWSRDGSSVDLTLMAGARDFGAHRFYSNRFPDQRESTSGELLTVRASTPVGASMLSAALRLDRHDDEFVLDRERPDWFRNTHETRGGLLELALRGSAGRWDWAAGLEGSRDEISSSNLGTHHRTRTAAFVEWGLLHGPSTISLQARVDHQDPWGTHPTVAFGGSTPLGRGWRLRGHAGTSFRVPSFTELYYTSPSRVGNPELEPEEGRTIEAGVDRGPWTATLFHRTADPIIDYVLDDDGIWRAVNLGRVRTHGLETALTLPTAGILRWQRVSLILLDSAITVDPERSAYALAHPRAEAGWTGSLDVGRGWSAGWGLRWRAPRDGGSWTTVDLRIGRRFFDQLTVSLEGSNLFDREITELHGIPLPGRWVTVTVQWKQP